MRQLDKNDYLKTRHFILLDYVQAGEKIASLKKEKLKGWKKIKNFLPTGE